MSTGTLMKELTWVQPKLVAQVRFVEWTTEGRLRHSKFLGLRSDKKASAVRREA
jgi:bifunctional non-homologous end joining protein LigD